MFTTDLVLETYKPDLWIFAQPLIWVDTTYGTIEVPQGFITDLASIPRLLRALPAYDPNGISRRPAAMHDWLYAWRGFGKAQADNFLRDSMLAEGSTGFDAATFWDAVHYCGEGAWENDAKVLGDIGLEDSFDTAEHYAAWAAKWHAPMALPPT